MYRSTVLRAVAVLVTASALSGAASAVSSTPAESVAADFTSGPFHITFNANRAANSPATAATGTFNATTGLGSATLITLAGPVTCLDIVGHDIGLFYAVGKANPEVIYTAVHGVYIYVTDSSTGKPLAVSFVPSLSGHANSCAPSPGLFPITSGTATIDPPAPATLAAAPTTLGVSNNSTLGKTIAVDSRGLTVYELSPETTHHLLCKKATGCFAVWPPLKVASAKTKLTGAKGIKGKLGILHRNGIFQVTLGGHPLYHFAPDRSKAGAASGQGIHSFGGRWHVVTATSTAPPTTPTTPIPPVYPPGY
jgi:predicted lipoprotein with Yx(FWY)xxD motif